MKGEGGGKGDWGMGRGGRVSAGGRWRDEVRQVQRGAFLGQVCCRGCLLLIMFARRLINPAGRTSESRRDHRLCSAGCKGHTL